MTQKQPKTKHPNYSTWNGMKQRCLSKANRAYPKYGGRGITICEEWMSFDNFNNDMGIRPGPGYSIDRINNDHGYNKENCRWATWKQQARNRRNNIYIGDRLAIEVSEEDGIGYHAAILRSKRGLPSFSITKEQKARKQMISDIGKEHDLKYNVIYYRLKTGWSLEDATTIPLLRTRIVDDDGLLLRSRIKESAIKLGTTIGAINNRIRNGWNIEKALTLPKRSTSGGNYHYKKQNRTIDQLKT